MLPCRPSAVYPVPMVAPPPQVGLADAPPPGVRMNSPQGTPGTLGGIGLRLLQAFFAAASVAVMVSTDVYRFFSAFRCPTPPFLSCLPVGFQLRDLRYGP
ncbi:CASP-like protein 5A2 [Hordeum vulgare]|nr:CASP-like protein 5A2 [Hordeum vulgare]